MGYMYKVFLKGRGIYGCAECGTHFVEKGKIVSKDYNGQHGRAYLFDNVVNVRAGEEDKRTMTTGVHIVQDITCIGCDSYVGWTYVEAFEESQKFKEGKFILEKELICDVTRDWDR
ncbi:yippee-like protein [Martensiomyces pterosporus]|nr:yippee-like protein [Martensiomyces pterosporus]